MKAVTTGKDGFVYLSRILTILLQTLLQDQIAEVGKLILILGFSLVREKGYFDPYF